VMDDESQPVESPEQEKPKPDKKHDFSATTMKDLETLLQSAIEKEEYEKASKIRDEINRRKKKT